MVEYSNPQPPEGINTSPQHPLKELVQLLLGIALIVMILVAVVSYSASWLAAKIPFRYEQRVGDQVFAEVDAEYSEQNRRLQRLADRITQAMELPPELAVQVHYNDDDTVNAYAFLGGHVVIYRGLLERLKSENALAMVMAHEIAHVQHRDVAKSLGRGVALGLLMSMVFGDGGGVADGIVSSGIHAGLLSFSRGQEHAADAAALAAVYRLYGHTQGALQLYEVLQQQQGQIPAALQVEFLSTHPLTENRVQELHRIAEERGWPRLGKLTPLRWPESHQ